MPNEVVNISFTRLENILIADRVEEFTINLSKYRFLIKSTGIFFLKRMNFDVCLIKMPLDINQTGIHNGKKNKEYLMWFRFNFYFSL